MTGVSVEEVEADLSSVLARVRRGERICLLDGRAKEPIAMIVPYVPRPAGKREIGALDGKATIEFAEDYEMSEDELLVGNTEEGR